MLVFATASFASTSLSVQQIILDAERHLVCHVQGAMLENHYQDSESSPAPDYDWWYGCSPTSAGMMMGFYDRYGYNGQNYKNLIKNGTAEMTTFPSVSNTWDFNAQSAIASSGHVNDFYRYSNSNFNDGSLPGNYGRFGDDNYNERDFDCLADFMGTSQDSVGTRNGATLFWNYDDGTRLYLNDIYNLGTSYYNFSGMYGLWEYFTYAGYGAGPLEDQNIFNQHIMGYNGITMGFTFDDYMAEINAGRVVMVHVEGHSMLGYGYDENNGEEIILLHDTWTEGEHSMLWGGSYGGMDLWGVTVFEPSQVPVPGALWLMISGFTGLICIRRRCK